MSSARSDPNYRHFVAIYRNDAITSGPQTFVCDSVKVETFREERTYRVREYMPAVLAAVQDAEYRIPSREPLVLLADNQHLILATRTRGKPTDEQLSREAAIDGVVAILSALVTRDLFRTLVFRGWIDSPTLGDRGPLLRFVDPIQIDGRTVANQYMAAQARVQRNSVLAGRFALMARFIAKGLAEAPREEAFVWLWTALEVFPMVGTSDIAPISEFLAPYLQLTPTTVKSRLRIGWLFGMRSKLIHDGHLPLTQQGAFSALARLELVVIAVLRHAGGLPYDGALDGILAENA